MKKKYVRYLIGMVALGVALFIIKMLFKKEEEFVVDIKSQANAGSKATASSNTSTTVTVTRGEVDDVIKKSFKDKMNLL